MGTNCRRITMRPHINELSHGRFMNCPYKFSTCDFILFHVSLSPIFLLPVSWGVLKRWWLWARDILCKGRLNSFSIRIVNTEEKVNKLVGGELAGRKSQTGKKPD